ncbi:hypothetical protein [Novosphingobium aerophilum]|uniref:hypothetical protein n=2 Tax=Novosphingobium aerophilum TaxID=2839843 RepID=UPI003FCF7B21
MLYRVRQSGAADQAFFGGNMQARWYKWGSRVVRLLQFGAAGVAATVLVNFQPDVVVGFAIDGPNSPWQIDDHLNCEADPASLSSKHPGTNEFDDIHRIAGGVPILGRLCLKARVSDQGEMLIPVSEEGSGWTGWPKDEATRYAQGMAAGFDPTSDVDRQAAVIAEKQAYVIWRERILDTLGAALAVIAGLEVFWRLAAWLVNGVVGIPKRKQSEAA